MMKFFCFLSLATCLMGCYTFAESVQQSKSGFNGSFELVHEHLPINWWCFTNKILSKSDFDFEVQQGSASDGQRCVHFDIRECDSIGGRLSPGLFSELTIEGNHTYRVSFDLRNQGSTLVFDAGPVSLKEGDRKILLTEKATLNDWTSYSFDIFVPAQDSLLYLQWNWIKPGQGWLDNVRVEKKV